MVTPWHHKHPGVRSGSELTLGERAADKIRNGMGSWPFVFAFLGTMAAWAAVNTLLIARVLHGKPFDPYPYILLNLGLSMVAGLQGAILLIAAKRQDQISGELALHDYQADQNSERMLTELSEGFKQMAEQHALMNQKVDTIHSIMTEDPRGPDEPPHVDCPECQSIYRTDGGN